MNKPLYGERDYASGQHILTVRTQLGLTQMGLASHLGVSRKAVAWWEAGSSYPTVEHLKQLIALGVQQQAFPAGREAEEIRVLWRTTHQKVLLDEAWLASLLGQTRRALTLLHPMLRETSRPGEVHATQPAPRLDWGAALASQSFYGREREQARLSQWIIEDRCRVVSVLGLGGIGKSALVVKVMHQVAEHFQVVLWRSLRDAPPCEVLLESCLQVLAPEPLADLPTSLEGRLELLQDYLREQRALLVFDNLECLLEEGEEIGHIRAGYEGYARLLREVAQTEHQSCLLLTSREKPAVLQGLESSRSLVRSLRLSGLEATACEKLLAEHEMTASPEEQARLGEIYAGNPLALHIVAETITELFGGAIDQFLSGGTIIFGGITRLLDEQWVRLSPLEQTVLCWLATLREPVSIAELQAVPVAPLLHAQVLEVVDGLHRRSLIERGQRPGSFTLQAVVLEYVTTRLVTLASAEIQQGQLLRLREQSFSQARAKEYVRQTQERLLLAPLLVRLQSAYQGRAEVERQLLTLLDALRGRAEEAQGYGPANLVALLRLLRGNLRGLDLSHLALRSAYLQGVEMQDANLSGNLMRECVLSEAFDAITAVTISKSGQYWAAISRQGEVRVWRVEQEAGQTLHLVWQAHTDNTFALAFSPDEHTLASGSHDGSVKVWDIASRTLSEGQASLLWSGWHTKGILCLAFSPDGSLLASCGINATVRIWDAKLGNKIENLPHPVPVGSLAWRPDGCLLASGDLEGNIRLWEMQQVGPARCVQILEGHTRRVRGLAFAPDGRQLASASYDDPIKLWEVGKGPGHHSYQTLEGHTEGVQTLVWSQDGGTLASGGLDRTIRLWDVEKRSTRAVLQGHNAVVYGLAFTPDSRSLLSGCDDGTLQLWETKSGELLRVMHGYTQLLYDLAWSPDGTRLASAGSDSLVTLWEVESSMAPRVLSGHRWSVYGVTWSPDGSRLASCGLDKTIQLWDPTTGTCVQVLRDHDVFFSVDWSPDGHSLASGTQVQSVLIWDMATHSQRGMDRRQASLIRHVAWSCDSTRLVGIGDDDHVFVWDSRAGTLLLQLAGHHGIAISVAWSLDGTRLASSCGCHDSGEIFVWDAHTGERVQTLVVGHPGAVSALCWAPSDGLVVSGSSDGMLRWWKVQSGECLREQEAHQGMIQSLKLSPDGSMLASCGDDGIIALWDIESGEALRKLRRDRPYERLTITGLRGLTQAQLASLRALGAAENEETLD
jgi:WD40 repeat protein/transcriptional regulator with XRE-family HTH domain